MYTYEYLSRVQRVFAVLLPCNWHIDPGDLDFGMTTRDKRVH